MIVRLRRQTKRKSTAGKSRLQGKSVGRLQVLDFQFIYKRCLKLATSAGDEKNNEDINRNEAPTDEALFSVHCIQQLNLQHKKCKRLQIDGTTIEQFRSTSWWVIVGCRSLGGISLIALRL